jgi:hypothetical protein
MKAHVEWDNSTWIGPVAVDMAAETLVHKVGKAAEHTNMVVAGIHRVVHV